MLTDEQKLLTVGFGNYYPLATVPPSPLAVAAQHAPLAVVDYANRSLVNERVQERNASMRSFSRDHATAACQWLAYRQPGESEIDIETGGSIGRKRLLFSEVETCYLRTRVRIR